MNITFIFRKDTKDLFLPDLQKLSVTILFKLCQPRMRHTERERHAERGETETHTHREKHGNTERNRERDRERQRKAERERHTRREREANGERETERDQQRQRGRNSSRERQRENPCLGCLLRLVVSVDSHWLLGLPSWLQYSRLVPPLPWTGS